MAPATRAKMHGGVPIDPTTGAVVVTGVAGGTAVDTELPAAALLADNAALPTAPIVGAALMLYDGTTLDLARSKGTSGGWQGVAIVRSTDGFELFPVSTPADAVADQASSLQAVHSKTFNGATWDRQRGNTEGTLLASAARTATATTANQTNHNARGVLLLLNVTVASGTGGLTVRIKGVDPVTGTAYYMSAAPTAVTTSGGFLSYVLYPGISASAFYTQASVGVLPRTWCVEVTHGDGSSYTYSLGYSLIV